ncbi:hypothetical protein B0H21DRAFT_533969 [Amylocystis lapponica]|nr:hypothetical protein B0H21DRAFT_533969 [Amylocystis lapponica]
MLQRIFGRASTEMPAHLNLSPPHRAEHIGSLLRPADLLAKRIEFEEKKCSAVELRAVEDTCIAAAVQLQQETGIKTITDGEYRRDAFYNGMFETLDGMTVMPFRPLDTFMSYVPYVAIFKAMQIPGYSSVYCTGKVTRNKGVYTEDFKYLTSIVAPEDIKNIKQTMCGPTWMHLRHGSEFTYDTTVYSNDVEYFADLVQAYREEIQALYDLGCRNIQFDDPTFSFYCDESMIAGMEQAGVDHEALLGMYIAVYNNIIRDRPVDLTVGVHTCRGNFKGMHYSEGSYARISVRLFRELDVDCYYLEYDNIRSGTLEPLRYLPLYKVVVLGFITTKTGELESVAEIKARVEQAVEIISQGEPRRSKADALQQICISPQCGFASVCEGNPLSEVDERKKLELVVGAAREIWA